MKSCNQAICRAQGFGLVELVLSLSLGSMVTLGAVQIAQAITKAFQLQQAQAQLTEQARFARATLATAVSQAGYHPTPWSTQSRAISNSSVDSINERSDLLSTRQMSDTNCFENANPVADADGQPLYYLKVTSVFRTDTGSLVLACDYGLEPDTLVRQINRLGLVENVELFKVRYAEDFNADGNADRWVRAGQWQREDQLRGVRLSLLLASPSPLGLKTSRTFTVMSEPVVTPTDGRLRQLFTFTLAIRGRK